MIVTGTPEQIDRFLSSPAGRRFAIARARAIFADDEALTAFELGLSAPVHPAVEAALEALIERRNAQEPA